MANQSSCQVARAATHPLGGTAISTLQRSGHVASALGVMMEANPPVGRTNRLGPISGKPGFGATRRCRGTENTCCSTATSSPKSSDLESGFINVASRESE